MPIHQGHDSEGPYYQWGNHGKKYYYTPGNEESRKHARQKAEQQAAAAHASGFHE